MTIMDDDPFDGVFDEPEANGDAEPTGDIDSEAAEQPVEDAPAEGGVDPSEDAEGAETDAEGLEEDPEDAAEEWLLEGRFRAGEEAKLAEAYQNLESFASRRENELREQMKAEREAAFEEARKMMEAQKPQEDPIEVGLRNHQRAEQLQYLALQDPAQAWEVAERSNDPALQQRVIDSILHGDPELGVAGDPATANLLNRRMVEQQSRNETQRLQSEFQQFKTQMAIDNAWNQVQAEHADVFAEDSPLREHVAAVLQEEMQRDEQALQQTGRSLYDFTDPQTVKRVFEQAIDTAVGRAYRAGAFAPPAETSTEGQAPAAPQVDKKQARLESGTPNRGSRQESKTFSQEFGDELMDLARDSAPHLFQ